MHLFRDLFYGAAKIPDINVYGKMAIEWQIWIDFEETCRGQIYVLPMNLPERTEENHKKKLESR